MRLLFAAAVLALVAGTAQAETVKFHAMLNGASEVPANTEKGTGMAMATLDTATKVLTYEITYSGLTGPAVAAHFHGPAAPTANAPPTVPLNPPASPIKGTATLTDAQIADLEAGRWYVNIHTAAHGPGEIRGQVTKQ
ncbi:MAG: CHRD domain-containing protein [Caulobacterales bacterium 32-69-10]|nr:MAG: CHRD domain-containing protein [Caulobacterales bacterium 32-69-10]